MTFAETDEIDMALNLAVREVPGWEKILEAMRYLNHPFREAHARRFVRPVLELLTEIQRTGDIFFPKRWMDATLGGHRSPEAAAGVRAYLSEPPELPERLRWVVLSAADDLFRTAGRRM